MNECRQCKRFAFGALWIVGGSLYSNLGQTCLLSRKATTNTAGDCGQRAGIHALRLTSIRRIKIYGPLPQSPCVMVPVFPGCQVICLLIVVSMEQCRYLAVSPCRDHQATIVLTYTFLTHNHGKETLVVGSRGAHLPNLLMGTAHPHSAPNAEPFIPPTPPVYTSPALDKGLFQIF